MNLKPDYVSDDGHVVLYRGDSTKIMPLMADNAVGLLATDPPYFKVKGEAWDRQWDKPHQFIEWIGGLCEQWQRLIKPNGSLYCFASPRMAAMVEVAVGERFGVLNQITWHKPGPSHAAIYGEERFRQFVQMSERCIFAEHFNADNMAKGEAGYQAKCDELRGFVFEPLRAYICGEFERAGMLTQEGKIAANVACGFSPSAGGMASRHYFSRSQWSLPTQAHYEAMRKLLCSSNCKTEYLRREYEDLRREYEDLRRPFTVTADVPYTDVWTFPTVQAYKGKHPCEKPLAMMEHIITVSSRPGDVVFDPFMGSGTTGVACVKTGRKFIGIELDPGYFDIAVKRIKAAYADGGLFNGKMHGEEQMGLGL